MFRWEVYTLPSFRAQTVELLVIWNAITLMWRHCNVKWSWHNICLAHYSTVIMDAIASHITSLTIVYSTVYTGADQRKHQSSASLAFVRRIHRWPVNYPHKGPVTRQMFPIDDVIMYCKENNWKVNKEEHISIRGSGTENAYCKIVVIQFLSLCAFSIILLGNCYKCLVELSILW